LPWRKETARNLKSKTQGWVNDHENPWVKERENPHCGASIHSALLEGMKFDLPFDLLNRGECIIVSSA
jgi:hypothetical protein